MAEVKNTRKKPVAKKPAQNAADATTEELEKTAPETAEQPMEQAKKPVKKKSSKQPAKTTISDQQEETGAAVAYEDTDVAESDETANVTEPTAENDVQPVAADEQKAEDPVADEEPAVKEEPKAENNVDEQKESATHSKKPAKTSGKKFALSKNMIIILSCVLALVIVGVILAVCLTSCKSGDDNNKKYTVTFMVDGEVVTTYKLSAGEKIGEPKNNPAKEMFTFDGWYLVNPNNANEEQKFEFGTTISQNITLVARFNGKSWTKIELNPNGGAFEGDKQVELLVSNDDKITEPEDEPTRVGYKFDGWYTEEECYNKFSFGVYPIENFTLYAGWTRDTENFVYVSYFGNDELLRVAPVRKGENVELPDFFADIDDLVVGDWMMDNNPNRPYTAGKATEDLDLYVNYYTDGLLFSVKGNTATVIGYNGTAAEVIVPSKYNGKNVTAVGKDAFYRSGQLSAITSVKLPNSIATIGEGAFYECQYLVSVNLTYNVNTIGKNAFYRNTRLRSVGDITGVEGDKLGEGAFNGCKELREIDLSNRLTQIAEYTFNDCTSLAEIVLPDALTEIGEYAFSGCTALKSVNLESWILATIADNAFAGCSSLTEVNIANPNGAVALQGNPFADCRNVTIYVPSALLDDYTNNTNYTQFKDKFAAR